MAKVSKQVREAIEAASAKRDEEEEWFFQAAKGQHGVEGEVEFDDDAVVSLSEDTSGVIGAYVQAWVYVEDGR